MPVGQLDADRVQPLTGHVGLEVAVIIQQIDGVVLAVHGENLTRVEHALVRGGLGLGLGVGLGVG